MRLAGKRAIITGGAGGLGHATAIRFIAEGACVLIADLVAPAVELGQPGTEVGEVAAVALDVTDPEGWRSVVAQARDRWGGIDILVNNAAVASTFTPLEERTPDAWDRSMAVNAKGPFLGTRAVLPVFRSQGGGAIVNIASVAGLGQSQIMDAAYACSKAAVTMLTQITAAQHAAEGVRCNAVHPGPIDSPLARSTYADEKALSRRLSRVPIGRFGQVQEIVAAILFLASDESSYITGASLAVDGGALVQ